MLDSPDTPRPSSIAAGTAAIILMTLAAFSPALAAGFVWDDDFHFTQNPYMTAPGGLRDLWVSHVFYYPLTSTVFWIMRRLFGLAPFPYHLLNVLLHAANALLLWRIARRLRLPGAWFAGALFAVHPVTVQSVAWATELKNTFSGLLFLLSLRAWLGFEESGRMSSWGVSLAAFALALFSKTSTVVLPFALPLIALARGSALNRRFAAAAAPFFALAAAAGLATVFFHRGIVSDPGEWDETLSQRLALAGRCLWFYLGKFAWPSSLAFVYPRWDAPAGPAAFIPLAAWGGLLTALAALRTRLGRGPLLAALWHMLALLPVLNLFKMYYARYSYVADHWMYLALMGLAPAAAAFALRAMEMLRSPSHDGTRLAARGLAAGLLLTAGMATWSQCRIYRDSETLWRDTLHKNPECWMAMTTLGGELLARGEATQARPLLEQSARLKPDHFQLQYNLARLALLDGDTAACAARLEAAIRLSPETYDPYVLLGVIRAQEGRLDDALPLLRRAVDLNPRLDSTHATIGKILLRMGRANEAQESFQRALEINPQNPDALAGLQSIGQP